MDIETIARKLEPLMPREVQRWLNARDTVDAEMRSLLEKQIIAVAHQKLGDFRVKPLLSLPQEKTARGRLHFGTVIYEAEKWSFGISHAELLQNMAIFGRSGAGKTNVAFHLLRQLAEQNIPFLFLDWKRTARHLLLQLNRKVNIYTPGRQLAPFPFNPFVPPAGLERHIYINQVIDIFARAYTLGDGVKSLLQKAITACYEQKDAPSVSDVITAVERLADHQRARQWKASALRALQSLEFSQLTSQAETTQEELMRLLLKQSTVIELDALDDNAKRFLIPVLCLWLYYARLAASDREKLKLVIFVEEAHHVFYGEERAKETVMSMLLRQCREIGIAMIVIDQHPHLISSAVLGNVYTSICLNLKNPSDINKAAALSLVEDSDRKHFSMLPIGQGIVKLQGRWERPVLVQFAKIDVPKGAMTDELLRRYLSQLQTRSGSTQAIHIESWQVQQVHLFDNALDEQALSFLYDVLQHENDGVKARYRRLGLSIGRGDRIKRELLRRGWLESAVIAVGRTRKLVLRVTATAQQALGFSNKKLERESLAHEYWKRYYAEFFRAHGFHVLLEGQRVGGRVDILASKNGKKIGIEIETGKSDVVANVKHGLRSKFDQLVVVTTDERALNIVERKLAQHGLLISNRVSVVLRDKLRGFP